MEPSDGMTTRPLRNSKNPPTPSGMNPPVVLVCWKWRWEL